MSPAEAALHTDPRDPNSDTPGHFGLGAGEGRWTLDAGRWTLNAEC